MRRRIEPDVVLSALAQVIKQVVKTRMDPLVSESDGVESLSESLYLKRDVLLSHQTLLKQRNGDLVAPVVADVCVVPIDRLWLILRSTSVALRPPRFRRSVQTLADQVPGIWSMITPNVWLTSVTVSSARQRQRTGMVSCSPVFWKVNADSCGIFCVLRKT